MPYLFLEDLVSSDSFSLVLFLAVLDLLSVLLLRFEEFALLVSCLDVLAASVLLLGSGFETLAVDLLEVPAL